MSAGENSFLEYYSSRPAALKPDEVIIWQGAASPPGQAAVKTRRDQFYFLTDQRLVVVDERFKYALRDRSHELPVRSLRIKPAGKTAHIAVDGWFELNYLEDWRGLYRAIASLPRKTRRYFMHRGKWTRRRRIRSTGPSARDLSMTMNANENPDIDELPLLDRERIIWSGIPSKWKRPSRFSVRKVLGSLVTLILPAGLIVIFVTSATTDRTVKYLIVFLCSFWIVVALYHMTVKPILESFRRTKVRYYLSNLRAFIVESGGRTRTTDILFLDGAGPGSALTENPDGTGDIHIGRQLTFHGIPNSREVHKLIMETIQAATGTFEGELER